MVKLYDSTMWSFRSFVALCQLWGRHNKPRSDFQVLLHIPGSLCIKLRGSGSQGFGRAPARHPESWQSSALPAVDLCGRPAMFNVTAQTVHCFNMFQHCSQSFTKNTFQADEKVSNNFYSNLQFKHFHTQEQNVSSSGTGSNGTCAWSIAEKSFIKNVFLFAFLVFPVLPCFTILFNCSSLSCSQNLLGNPFDRVSCFFIPHFRLRDVSRHFRRHLVTALALEVGAHESSSFVVKERNVPRASQGRWKTKRKTKRNETKRNKRAIQQKHFWFQQLHSRAAQSQSVF